MRYDAVAFLDRLFQPSALTPADLPGDWYVLWDERAAIMEYDGGLPRARAEQLALQEVIEQMKVAERRSCRPGNR